MGWVVSVTPRPLFIPGKRTPLPIVQEAGWAPEPVWTQRFEEKSFRLCRGSNLDRPINVLHCTDFNESEVLPVTFDEGDNTKFNTNPFTSFGYETRRSTGRETPFASTFYTAQMTLDATNVAFIYKDRLRLKDWFMSSRFAVPLQLMKNIILAVVSYTWHTDQETLA
jgi:hypothetical protein